MDGKDLAGVIFVIVFLPLIIVLTALCLWCNRHPRSGRNCQKPTPSRTTEMQLPYFNSPPFDGAYFSPHSKPSSYNRSKRYAPNKYVSGQPRYTPRIHTDNTTHKLPMRQQRRQQLRDELYDGFDITPEMVRPQSPDSAYADLDITYEMLGGRRQRSVLARAGRPRRGSAPS
jgi:hypothetical protein